MDANSSKPGNTIVIKLKQTFVDLDGILAVLNGGWLSSDFINAYLNMALWCQNIQISSDVCVMDSYFTQRFPRQKGFELSSRVINGHILGKAQFESAKKILIPMNLGNLHWIVAKIDRQTKIIYVYDSQNPQTLRNNYHDPRLETPLESFLHCKVPGLQFESEKYQFKYELSTHQNDQVNCGLFTILNLLDQLGLINFRIESSREFFRTIRTIFFHELVSAEAFDTSITGFILNML